MNPKGKRLQQEQEDIVEATNMEQEEMVPEDVCKDKLAEDIKLLQTELEKLQKDAEESHDRYLRTLADFDNFRKRQRDETTRLINAARDELLLQVISIMDNFNRTLQAAESTHTYESLLEGVNLTVRQMKEMLEREGVQEISAVGEEFNPEVHEAVMREETDEYPENTIIDEFEKGYIINGRVLRPARVRVAVK